MGSFAAQVNALTLQYTVDIINSLVENGKGLAEGWNILVTISVILLSKEIINAFVTFGQKFYGEKLRILVSQDWAQAIIQIILPYRMAFYTNNDNQAGKLQTRIDRGIESLTRLVQNLLIDFLPQFANAFMALYLMFNANFYVGLVGILILPFYFFITQRQAMILRGW
ncbi:ABC transporter transmembrane domain-containing protein [Vaginella massiliensis]|uniref:ABC transporter transmembrane domain-containing protein n=1 Tax=Vaginella massiliensis TaxID=1816680 RepID=UPI00375212E4